jgi:hypothetical protein
MGFQMPPPYDDQNPEGIKAAWRQDDSYARGITGDLAWILHWIWLIAGWPLRAAFRLTLRALRRLDRP